MCYFRLLSFEIQSIFIIQVFHNCKFTYSQFTYNPKPTLILLSWSFKNMYRVVKIWIGWCACCQLRQGLGFSSYTINKCPFYKLFWYHAFGDFCWYFTFNFLFFSFLLIFVFLGLHLWHMEVPRLGVESELQLLAYTIATATWDQSCICRPIPQLTATPDS